MNYQSLAARADKEVTFWKNELERAIQEKHGLQDKLQAARLDNKLLRFELLRTQQVLTEVCEENDIPLPDLAGNKTSMPATTPRSIHGSIPTYRSRTRTSRPQQHSKAVVAAVKQQLTSARVQLQEAAVHVTMLEEKARMLSKDSAKLQKENLRLKAALAGNGAAVSSKKSSGSRSRKATASVLSSGDGSKGPDGKPAGLSSGLSQQSHVRASRTRGTSSYASDAPPDWTDIATMMMVMQNAQAARQPAKDRSVSPTPEAPSSITEFAHPRPPHGETPDSSLTLGSSSFEQYLSGAGTSTVFRSLQPTTQAWSEAGSEVSLAASLAAKQEEWRALQDTAML